MGHLINRRTRELSGDDISKIAQTYHNWRTGEGKYEDAQRFLQKRENRRSKDTQLRPDPGRYVGLAEEEDEFNFAERF